MIDGSPDLAEESNTGRPVGQQLGEGDRSFSEVIADTLDNGGGLADVTGQQILEPETYDDINAEIERLSDGTLNRLTDETPQS